METNKKYIDLIGDDYTEWMTSPEQIALFNKLVELQEYCKRPVPQCYKEVVEALNIANQIKGMPKRAFIQADPRLN